ncbi:unnamed protein product, partial [Larinioides sclopetarius]
MVSPPSHLQRSSVRVSRVHRYPIYAICVIFGGVTSRRNSGVVTIP